MDNNKSDKNDKKNLNSILEWIKSISIAIIIVIFIKTFIFNIIYVSGTSMRPTLEEGDILFLKKYATTFNVEKYDRGDIIVFKSPFKKDKRLFVKRVIGVSGDIVEIKNGKIYLNNIPLKEEYIDEGVYTYFHDINVWEIKKNELFVVGDNRLPGASNDSRTFDVIYSDEVEGKVLFKFFPFKKMQ